MRQLGNQNAAKTNVSNSNICFTDDSDRAVGTTRANALRRLRKDRPDLHKQVIEKKLSPHAAMVKAGFRPKTITIPVDVEKAARVLVKNFDGDIDELIQAIKRAAGK